MRNLFFMSLLVLFCTQCLQAQSESRFYAEASQKEVAVGQTFQISFVLENGKNNGRFSPPDWESAGFMVLGSSQSTNISMINGQTTTSATYQFSVTPFKEGNLVVPAVRIKNGDGELQTEPVNITAIPSPDGVELNLPKRTPETPQPEPKKNFKTYKM